MSRRFFSLCIGAAALPMCMLGTTVVSPDGRLELHTSLQGGVPEYSITYCGKSMLADSPLGVVCGAADFSKGLILISDTVVSYDVNFRQDRIKTSDVKFHGSRLISKYRNAAGETLGVEWIVGNNDVAFRYLIPRLGKNGDTGSAVVKKETTGFRLPEGTTTFITPQSDAMIGWKRTKPSYEENYTNDAPMTEKSQYGHGYTFPALFRVGDDGWVLLSETGVDGSYCGSRLSDYADGVYTIAYPMPEENNGNGSSSPGIALPGATPWRTITLGDNLKPIVETVIPWVPLTPLYEAEAFNSGKGTWSWIIWQDGSINYDDQVKFIDLAADMGYQHALIDNWWNTNIGRGGMEKLAKYAQSKGTNIAVWYSSSGWWNDIVQGPTDLMSRPIPRKKEMKWLHDIGVKAIKVDFFGGDKQETLRLYEDILSDAADYGISVIFHGCTLPRGWERLYPNYIGSEAVLASENLVFQQDFCDREAFNATLHPFIRNTVGSMEYGGTCLNKRFGKGGDKGNIRRTTDAFQLATSVLFQNPVQNFALTPEAYETAPAAAIEFLRQVPTVWDETVYIDGYPGKYCVLARRSGDRWYVAAVNAEKEAKKLKLQLPMLAGNRMKMYGDDKERKLKESEAATDKKGELTVTIQPDGGLVLISGK